MIGSGFSRNARGVRPRTKPIPLSGGIAAELHKTLYSREDMHTAGDAVSNSPPRDDVSRIAEEYRSEFGSRELHNSLKRLVRDEDFVPGKAHKRLLRLPWADVFTTNWDTLLERASTLVRDPSYQVVHTAKDLRGTSGLPRIVKLHGSLPDSPLIISTEDYRKYPSDYAPFENTVRQKMMETSFLLLGFSGNDPNFRDWSGWVRDQFEELSLGIYLAGYLRLPGPARRALTKRHIIPIDLARHPIAKDWPRHRRHERATEWILSTLEARPRHLPEQSAPQDRPVRVDARPIVKSAAANVSPKLLDEPLEPPPLGSIKDPLKAVRETLEVWTHNRKRYPGWLVPPAHVRRDQRVSTERWTSLMLEVFPNLSPLSRLSAIREIIWRYERLLTWIPDELRAAAQDTLESIDCTSQADEETGEANNDWNEVRHSWREVALGLLTAARYRFETSAFNELLHALEPLVVDDPEASHRVHHERCLWALWSLDFESLIKWLDKWATEEGDPVWKIRKSALLRELGREDEAAELVERAQEDARAMPVNEGDIRGPSREGWALWSVATFSKFDDVRQRWNELAAVNCDPSMEIEWLVNALTASDRKTATPSFELGVRPKEPHRPSTSLLEAAAYRSIRLTEVAGLPLAVEFTGISGHLLKLASERLATCDPYMAICLMLRVARYDRDDAFMRVLSRKRIAVLPKSLADSLATGARRALRYAMSRIEEVGVKRSVLWTERARVLMEAVSRLVLRLDGSSAESVLHDALKLYVSPVVASEMWLHEALGNTFSRCWESFSDSQRRTRALDLMDAPIVGVDGPDSDWSWYPDPGQVVSEKGLPLRSASNEGRWQAIVKRIIRGLSATGVARERAARRLVAPALSGRLTEGESARVARALWAGVSDGGDEMPQGTPVFDYAFILLPEPRVGVARRRFGRKWLSGDVADVSLTGLTGRRGSVGLSGTHTDPRHADDIVWQVGLSIPFLRRHGSALGLAAGEREYLTAVIERWTNTRMKVLRSIPELIQHERMQSLRGACRGLSWILTEMQVATSLVERLYDKVHELNDVGVPAYSMLPGIAKALPDQIGDIRLLMSAGLVSDDREMAQNVVVTLHRWMIWAADLTLGMMPVPKQLVRDIGISIGARRQAVVAQALDCAKWIFDEGSDEQREIIRDLAIKGLEHLIGEVRYDREDGWDDDVDVPLIRQRCVGVARALAKTGWGGDPVVRRWLETGRDDPLPEVRHVAERWYREGMGMSVSRQRHARGPTDAGRKESFD